MPPQLSDQVCKKIIVYFIKYKDINFIYTTTIVLVSQIT